MMAKLKPFPAMKDSGAEWLGEVPEHWEMPSLGRILIQRKERNDPIKTKDILSLSLHKGVIPYAEKPAGGNKAKEDLSSYMLAYPGDIVVNSMNVIVGSVGLSKHFGAVSPVYYMLRPRLPEDVVEFFDQVFRSSVFQKSLFGLGNGIMYVESKSGKLNTIRLRIPMTKLKKVVLPHPPPPEQAAIVRYLDYVDRRVRRLVRAKRKMIALLTEQKQAIIHRAVTRGLDPNVPMKDSGVEWLGEVPAHWDVILLGRGLIAIGQGWSPVAAEGELTQDQWAVLTLSSVKKGRFIPEAIKPIPVTAVIPDGIVIDDGDLLLTRSNTRDLVGDVCVVSGARPKTIICDLIYRLTPDPRFFNSVFLMYQLLSSVGRRQIEQDARGSSGTMPKISQRHIRSWRLLSPPLDEQRRISDLIISETEQIEIAITNGYREIDLLNEYRNRLIADVVTGKLDVREAATKLPEVDPLDTIDGPDEAFDSDSEEDLNEVEAITEEDET